MKQISTDKILKDFCNISAYYEKYSIKQLKQMGIDNIHLDVYNVTKTDIDEVASKYDFNIECNIPILSYNVSMNDIMNDIITKHNLKLLNE